jgi:hypothetical protein
MRARKKLLSEAAKEESCEARGREGEKEDPYSLFLFGMKSHKTREKCVGRLRMFFDFINITEVL